MMKAAGMIPPPEQMRMSVGSGDADGHFENYADRIANLTPFLTDETKAMLGGLYAAAEYEGSGPTSLEMKRIDALARELALLAMRDAFWRSVDESRRDDTHSSGPTAEAASRTRRLDTHA